MKTQYAISAGHESTVEVAQTILEAGGNAVDAAVAALLATFVVEPCMSSAGGGGFAMVYEPGQEVQIVDFFCQTPKEKFDGGKADFYPIEVDFGEVKEVFHVGMGSTAVPGSIGGIFAMHRRWGKMPMSELVQPAIRLAKEGVIVNDFQHEDFVLLRNILQVDPKAAPIFFPDGEFIQLGDRQFMPEQADFLEYLGKEGPDFFYKGEIARTICEDHLEGGGFLRRHDFETYEAVFRKPLQFWFRDNQILTNPLPSTGGMSLLMAFHAYDERGDAADIFEKEHVAILVEVLQQLDRFKKHPQAFQTWLTENLPEFGKFQFGLPKDRKWGSTTHFNIVDEKGMAVSLTSTNGEGSGYFVRHTGVQLNNMLGESALLPNGFHSWTPDHRLSSMMSPSMVLDKSGLLEVVMGSGGASRIPTAIFQVLLNLLQYDYSLNKSVDLPRVHLEHGELNIEAANNLNFASDVYPKKKEWTDYSLFFGGVHALRRTASFWEAVGDHRRDGVALLS